MNNFESFDKNLKRVIPSSSNKKHEKNQRKKKKINKSTATVSEATNKNSCEMFENFDNYFGNDLQSSTRNSGSQMSDHTINVAEDDDDYTVAGEEIPNGTIPELYSILSDSDSQHDEIYDGSPHSLGTSLMLVLSYSVRHNLTNEGLDDVLFLSSLHMKKPANYKKLYVIC